MHRKKRKKREKKGIERKQIEISGVVEFYFINLICLLRYILI